MEFATVISWVLSFVILVLLLLMVATEGGSEQRSSSSQSADRHVQELHRQAEAGRQHMDAISDDYLRKVKEITRR